MNRLITLLLAVLVHAVTLAFVVTGVWIAAVNAEMVFGWLVGGVLVALGWMLRPRLGGRLPADAEVLGREAAAELYGLAERVADRAGGPRPREVAVRDLDPVSRLLRVGPFRRPVLVVGLPLWLALSPRQRAAALALAYAETPTVEELVVDGALATLGEWREALLGAAPLEVRHEAQTKVLASSLGPLHQPGTGYEAAGLLGRLLGRVLGSPLLLLERGLTRLARADAGRVERRREDLARRVVPARDLAEVRGLLASGRYLAPMQAAALRGESVPAIREQALARAALPSAGPEQGREQGREQGSGQNSGRDSGRGSGRGSDAGSELLGAAESHRIDDELLRHYTRAIRGFGLIA
ncbi:hypothetical protein AB0H64_33640 [Nonomuraea sp. NPDC050733]|uniref:hypothetical protein n=1 Tax=Nonomuraea sp. NPDC050733 TaxID=3154633 RepID=UPI0033E16851